MRGTRRENNRISHAVTKEGTLSLHFRVLFLCFWTGKWGGKERDATLFHFFLELMADSYKQCLPREQLFFRFPSRRSLFVRDPQTIKLRGTRDSHRIPFTPSNPLLLTRKQNMKFPALFTSKRKLGSACVTAHGASPVAVGSWPDLVLFARPIDRSLLSRVAFRLLSSNGHKNRCR